MQPNEFQYTIVIPGIADYVLINAPSGWEDNTEVSFKRSEIYAGQVRSLTVPLKFTTEGALILRNQYYQYNAQAQAYIKIEKQNPSTWEYDLAFYGRLDFTKANDQDDYFTINAIDADISVKIKAFESVKYEIPVDVPEAVTLTLTPIRLTESAEFIFNGNIDFRSNAFFAMTVVANEQKGVIASVQDVGFFADTSPNWATDEHWFFRAQVDTDVRYKGYFEGSIQPPFTSEPQQFKIKIVRSDGAVLSVLYDYTTTSTDTIPFSFDYDVTSNVLNGQKLFVYFEHTGSESTFEGFMLTNCDLSLSYYTESAETQCKALRPKYLFQQLIKKINSGFDYPIQSVLLDQWDNLTITSGDAIRQIDGAKIKTSFTDFFKSISAVTCAGHGVENNTATIEARQSYFRNIKTLSMLDSKNVNINTANELLFNAIKVGYPDQTYDEVNGKDEINSQQEYFIDSLGTDKTLDLMSVYRADSYGIEFLRINLEGKNSTDSDSDNDVFFVYANKLPEIDGTYKPFKDGIVTGVTSGNSLYNWYISPKRNLKRWGAYIRSVYYKNDGYQIRFTQGLKNTAVTTVSGGISVTENSNLYMSELDLPYFMPIWATFTTRLPADLYKYFNSGVYGYGEFMFRGVVLNGFFQESEIDLAMNSEREFKLLLTVNNNLTELIV